MDIEDLENKLSDGSKALIKALKENDVNHYYSNNFALAEVLKCCAKVIEVTKTRNFDAINNFLVPSEMPSNIILFIHRFLRYLNESFDKRIILDKSLIIQCDYNRFLLQGLAATFAEIVPNRNSQEILIMNIHDYLVELGNIDIIEFWCALLKNYFGEVFLYYFSDMRIRENIPSLPNDTEINLREIDAYYISLVIKDLYLKENDKVLNFSKFLKIFSQVLSKI